MRIAWWMAALVMVGGCRLGEKKPAPADTTVARPDSAPVFDVDSQTKADNIQPEDTSDVYLPPMLEDTTTVSAGPRRLTAAAGWNVYTTGVGAGLSQYPPDLWGQVFNATVYVTRPANLIKTLRAKCPGGNGPIKIAYQMPRGMINNTGESRRGYFVLSNGLKAEDELHRYMPPDSIDKYQNCLALWFAIDEPWCASCWSGRAADDGDLTTFLRAYRSKVDPKGRIPIMVRAKPTLIAAHNVPDDAVDVAWTVWNENRGDFTKLFNQQWQTAQNHGWQMGGSFVPDNCGGVGTNPCSPSEVVTYGTRVVEFDGVCLSVNYVWRSDMWTTAYKDAWGKVALAASQEPTRDCK